MVTLFVFAAVGATAGVALLVTVLLDDGVLDFKEIL